MPNITSVAVSSNTDNPVQVGSTVAVTCVVELSVAVTEEELSLLTVNAKLTGGGSTPTSSGPTVPGTTFTYSFSLGPFMRTDSDNYTCMATITPAESDSSFLAAAVTGQREDIVRITTGKLACGYTYVRGT